ncbi:MAG: hypothetical protein HY683_10195 [Chloroflexi bacterium]|nr:hypothetical protein [Chloroflexota bacterium]
MDERERWSEPPRIEQPSIFPIEWRTETLKFVELYEKARREYWNPATLPWKDLDPADFTREQRMAIAYWFSTLANFDASGPAAFARALVHTYEQHEEDPLRKCFFSITRDEVNHEEFCQRSLERLWPGAPLNWEPKTDLEKLAVRNLKWLYYNGSRYWKGYKNAFDKYRIPVLFTSFFMGETAAATLFHHMAKNAQHSLFQQGFRNVGRDEARHMAITLYLFEKEAPKLTDEERVQVTRQLRAGFVFLSMILYEPPEQFWQLPPDYLDVHRELEKIARNAGLGVATLEDKRKVWHDAMLKVKGIAEKYSIEFPAMPEVGITGKEVVDVDENSIIPVF